MSEPALDRLFPRSDTFLHRHNGPRDAELPAMLEACGVQTLDELMDRSLPAAIRWHGTLATPAAVGERQSLADLVHHDHADGARLGRRTRGVETAARQPVARQTVAR